jgi:hypothetical protein
MEETISDLKLEESDTIEEDKVLLNRSWTFWENYEAKNKDKSYLIKEIYTFDNIISFWQFWNRYPGNDTKAIFYNGEYMKYFFKEKYRISAINLFQKGIRPEWEDDRNKNGYTLMLEYIVKDNIEQFYTLVTEKWVKLMCFLIGETIPYSNNINGIRFVDKTKFGYNKSIVFRFEIWVDSSIKENEVDELKKKLSTEFGCMATVKSNKK